MEKKSLSVDLEKLYEHINDRNQKNKVILETIGDKKVFYPFGYTGAGKTTFLLYANGQELQKNSSGRFEVAGELPLELKHLQIGQEAKSCTIYVSATAYKKFVFLDGPGFNDTEGPIIDIANVVAMYSIFGQLKNLTPILFLDYPMFFVERGSGLRKIMDAFCGMFKNDTELLEKYMVVVWTKVPEEVTLDILQSELKKLKDAETEATSVAVGELLDIISVGIKNTLTRKSDKSMYGRVFLFKPLDFRGSKNIRSLFKRIRQIENPSNQFEVSLPIESKLSLENSLKELKLIVPSWLENGETLKLSNHMFLLTELAKIIPTVKSTLNDCAHSLHSNLESRIIDSKIQLQMILSGEEINEIAIQKIIDTNTILTKIESVREFMDSLEKIDEFHKYISNQLKSLTNKIIQTKDLNFIKIGLTLKKLNLLQKYFNFLNDFNSIKKEFVDWVILVVTNLKDNILKTSLTPDNVDDFVTEIEKLKDASNEIAPYLPFDADMLVKEIITKQNENLDQLMTIVANNIDNPSKIDQETILNYQTIFTVSKNKRFSSLFNDNNNSNNKHTNTENRYFILKQKCLDSTENALNQLKNLSTTNSMLEQTSEKYILTVKSISKLDRVILESTDIELTKILLVFENQVDLIIDKLQTLVLFRPEGPDYKAVPPLMQKLDSCKWLDNYSLTGNRITQKKEEAVIHLTSSLKNTTMKIKTFYIRGKYEEVEILYNIIENDLLPLQNSVPLYSEEKMGITQYLIDQLNNIYKFGQEKIDVKNDLIVSSSKFTLSEADTYLGSLNKLKSLSVTLGQSDAHNTTVKKVNNYLNNLCKGWISQIVSDKECKWEDYNKILDNLLMIKSETEFPNLNNTLRVYDDALNRTRCRIRQLEAEVDRYVQEEKLDLIPKILEILENSIVLISHLPDIIEVVQNVRLKRTDAVKNLADVIKSDFKFGDYLHLKNQLDTLPEDQKKHSIRFIKNSLQNMATTIRRDISFYKVFSGEPEETRRHGFENIRREIVKFQEGREAFQSSFPDEKFFDEALTEMYGAIDSNFHSELLQIKDEVGKNITYQEMEKHVNYINRLTITIGLKYLTKTKELIEELRKSADLNWDQFDKYITKIDQYCDEVDRLYEVLVQLNHTRKTHYFAQIRRAIISFSNLAKEAETINLSIQYLEKLHQLSYSFNNSDLKKIATDNYKLTSEEIKNCRSNKTNEFQSYLSSLEFDKITNFLDQNQKDNQLFTACKITLKERLMKLFTPFHSLSSDDYKKNGKIFIYIIQVYFKYPELINKDFLYDNINKLKELGCKHINSTNSIISMSPITYDLLNNISNNIKCIIEIKTLENDINTVFIDKKIEIISDNNLSSFLTGICTIFNNNKQDLETSISCCEFLKISDTLKTIQFTDTLLESLKLFLFPNENLSPVFKPLSLTLKNCTNFEESKRIVSNWLQSMNDKVKQHWEDKQYLPIVKLLRAIKGKQFQHLKIYCSNIESTLNIVESSIIQAYDDLSSITLSHLNNEEWKKFKICLSALQNLGEIEAILGKNTYQSIKKTMKERIEELNNHTLVNSNIDSIADSLVKLNDLSLNVPIIENDVKMVSNNIINRCSQNGGQSYLYELGLKLEKYEGALAKNAHDVVSSFKVFSSVNLEMWQQKTKSQDINWALDIDENSNPRFLFSNTFEKGSTNDLWSLQNCVNFFKNKLGIDQVSKYKRQVNEFDSFFKNKFDSLKDINDFVDETKEFFERSNKVINNLVEIIARICVVWSKLKSSGGNFILRPHPLQILCFFRLLDCEVVGVNLKFYNQLIEVLTGEGKSIILGVISTFFALLGYEVFTICYSEYLSLRDYSDFEEVFEKFQIKNMVYYSTISSMCETIINEKGNIRELTKTIIESGNKIEKSNIKKSIKGRVLLIDEVDVFFGSSFYGNTYNPATIITNESIYGILEFIYSNKKNIDFLTVLNLKYYIDLVKNFSRLKPLINHEIQKMLKDVKNFEDTPEKPIVMNGLIYYKDQDSVTCKIVYGYKTCFQYFHKKIEGELTEENVKNNVGLYVGCGNFSFAEIPSDFTFKMGVSGTLRSLTNEEREIVQSYDIQRLAYAPSIYGGSRINEKSSSKSSFITLCKTESDWFLRIVQNCQDKQLSGRAVLIFFEDTLMLKKFEKTNFSSLKSCQILEEKEEYKESIIKSATVSGTVTLCSRPFGRGVDFICRDPKTREKDGVHIIQTFVSSCEAEQIQIKGRTARQGDPGSHEFILYHGNLVKYLGTQEGQPEDYGFKNWDIDSQLDQLNLVTKINKLRDKLYAAEVAELGTKRKEVLKAHTFTKNFHEALIKYDGTPASRDSITEKIMSMNQESVSAATFKYHLYFCLDESGSMSGRPWEDLLSAVRAFLVKRIEMCNLNGSVVQDLVTVINYASSGRVVFHSKPLVIDLYKSITYNSGGTDFAAGLNLVLRTMKSIIQNDYLPILIFMSDGGSSNGENEMERIVKEIQNVKVFVVGFSSGCDREKMKKMALAGNGQFSFGTDGSQLKDEFEQISVKLSGGVMAL